MMDKNIAGTELNTHAFITCSDGLSGTTLMKPDFLEEFSLYENDIAFERVVGEGTPKILENYGIEVAVFKHCTDGCK